jgi:hypothetical protein
MADDNSTNQKPADKPGPTRPAPPLRPNPDLDNYLKKGGDDPRTIETRIRK